MYTSLCIMLCSIRSAHHGDGVHGVEYGEEENVILGVRHVWGNGATHTRADSIRRPGAYSACHTHT